MLICHRFNWIVFYLYCRKCLLVWLRFLWFINLLKLSNPDAFTSRIYFKLFFYFLVLQNFCVKIFQHILLWVEEQTYWIASRFLILGFELELYSPSEYCMVYWYIYVVLIKLSEKTHLKMAAKNDTGKYAR